MTDADTDSADKTIAPYGSWPSPITAKFITTSGVALGSLSVEPSTGALFWLEGRPQEGGRQVVVRRAPDDPGASERGAVDTVPADTNVRTRVHEYGGAAYVLGPNGQGVIFSDFKTQRLFWAKGGSPEETPLCLTPAETAPDGQYRFADGRVDPTGQWLVCVREDHGPAGDASPQQVVNEVVQVKLDGSGEVAVLATGKDFYAAPRLSPDGARLAYVCWDHPNMPWDATQLRLTNWDPAGAAAGGAARTETHALVAGGDGDTSVLQPAWHPATGSLYYLSDASGFYNLYRLPPHDAKSDAAAGGGGGGVSVLPRAVDFGGAAPGWSLGQQGFAFLSDGRVAATYPDRATGRTALAVFDEYDGDTVGESGGDVAAFVASSVAVLSGPADGLPHSVSALCPAPGGRGEAEEGEAAAAAAAAVVYLVGGGPDVPSGVYEWRCPRRLAHGGTAPATAAAPVPAELLACASSARVAGGFVAVPQPVTFPSAKEDSVAHGYYYPPTHPTHASDEAGGPPLLVKAHGGPTACAGTSFNPGIQFFTSRGFAVLDVDYGGSTGYGREYRRRLRGAWGEVDIDDVCAGAQYLVGRGLADPKRLAIDGGSAGGFTTLGALAFKDVFTAGCSLYGVADCSALAADTHKFESRYLDGLIGRYPEDKALYDSRSAINALEGLSCPILLLQGDEDKIVPPNQAEAMHAALLAKGLPCALKMYTGEQHGFRKAENIEDALNSEIFFYSKIFKFECAGDDIKPFAIDNME